MWPDRRNRCADSSVKSEMLQICVCILGPLTKVCFLCSWATKLLSFCISSIKLLLFFYHQIENQSWLNYALSCTPRRQAPAHLNQSSIKAWLIATGIAEVSERQICSDCLAVLLCAPLIPPDLLSRLHNLSKTLSEISTNINKTSPCPQRSAVQPSFPLLIKRPML